MKLYNYIAAKRSILLLMSLLNLSTQAQQIITTKGDRLSKDAIVVEPWQKESTTDKAILNTDNVYQQGNVGIGDFSSSTPTQKLDVIGNVRIRGLINANTQALRTQYNKNVTADVNGNLAIVDSKLNSAPWVNTYADGATMTVPVTSQVATGNTDLALEVPVTIPPFTTALIRIDYNSPVQHVGSVAYIGYTLFKSLGSVDVELPMGSRKYAVFGNYYNSATVYGIFIEGLAVDNYTNNTSSPVVINYKLKGYNEAKASGASVTFGMSAATGAGTNYNWGRGGLGVQLFVKPIN